MGYGLWAMGERRGQAACSRTDEGSEGKKKKKKLFREKESDFCFSFFFPQTIPSVHYSL